LGIIFGASSLYLVLKVGMTVWPRFRGRALDQLFRAFTKCSASARDDLGKQHRADHRLGGESIASASRDHAGRDDLGFEMEISRVMVVSVLGASLASS